MPDGAAILYFQKSRKTIILYEPYLKYNTLVECMKIDEINIVLIRHFDMYLTKFYVELDLYMFLVFFS